MRDALPSLFGSHSPLVQALFWQQRSRGTYLLSTLPVCCGSFVVHHQDHFVCLVSDGGESGSLIYTVVLVTAPGLCALQCNSDPASQIVILRRSAWLIISLLSIFCAAVCIIFSRNAQSQTYTHCWTCHTSLGALFTLLASFPRVDNQLEMSDRHFSALMVLLYMQRNC